MTLIFGTAWAWIFPSPALTEPHVCYFSAGKETECFDCNSNDDPRCGDPFVFTAHTRDMPDTKQCDGCCVKLVQHRGTGGQ